ncbi:hypothetical protein GCM10027341_55190 [Spirosoma knui]
MRPFLFLLASLYTSVCFAQNDSTKQTQGPAQTQVLIPGIDSPVSSPGALMQSSPRPNAVPAAQPAQRKGKVRTAPPSDPRAFGVGIPVGKPKKDTLRR